MTDMTLAEALALADQDSPMPHLAGQALKVLRAELLRWRPDDAWVAAQKEVVPLDLSVEPLNQLFIRQKDCWCQACRPLTLTDQRMVLCPTCGNKRCPHANDHRNACTGSNAVGQPGSSWEHVKPITTSTTKDC